MAITSIGGAAAGGINGATTSGVDTTGATILLLAVATDNGVPALSTVSDSKSNTWTALTARSTTNCRTRLYYVLNPSVGASHTVTVNEVGGAVSLAFHAFGGVTFTYEQEAAGGNASGVVTISPGSQTPGSNGALVVSNFANASGVLSGLACGSGLTVYQHSPYTGGSNYGSALSALEQTTAAAINPAWTWTNNVDAVASGAVFTVVPGGAQNVLAWTVA